MTTGIAHCPACKVATDYADDVFMRHLRRDRIGDCRMSERAVPVDAERIED